MNKLYFLLLLLLGNLGLTRGQLQAPIVEDFESMISFPSAPWQPANSAISFIKYTPVKSGFRSLLCGGGWTFRTDVVYGNIGEKLSWWVYFTGNGIINLGFGADSGNSYSIRLSRNTNTIDIQNNSAWGFFSFLSIPQNFALDQWYKVEVEFPMPSTITCKLFGSDGVSLLNTINNYNVPGLNPGGLSLFGIGGVVVDEIRAGVPGSTFTFYSPLAPIANFFPSMPTTNGIPTDTVWINTKFDLVSTSTNTTRNYWNLPSEANLLPGYTRSFIDSTFRPYIDTAKYNQRFTYTFNRSGFWPVWLLAQNNLYKDSVLRYIYVDTPSTKAIPNFFAAKRKVSTGEFIPLQNLSENGANGWHWTMNPPCYACGNVPYFNNFFDNPTYQNPLFFGGDPGKYTICLQAWNARGSDTICKKDYLEVIKSYNLCSGGNILKSANKEGFLNNGYGLQFGYIRSQFISCKGFLIEPCSDSIILWVEQLKLFPSDSIVIYNGNDENAPILRTIGGASISQLPLEINQNGIRGSKRLFIQFKVGTQVIPPGFGSAFFSLRWESNQATFSIPSSQIDIPDTIFSLEPISYRHKSSGELMQFSWDTDGNGVYDSTKESFTRTFSIATPSYRKLCLATYNCIGSDTACKTVLFLPNSQKPIVRIEVDKVQGFNTDTFHFSDKSSNGPNNWNWTFTPSSVQYLMGTNQYSKNPIVRFTQRTKYTVKLVAANIIGSDQQILVDYINIGAYDQPQCLSDINLTDGSIGISRVRLESGLDTSTNANNPCFEIIEGNQIAQMYRGKKHVLEVIRAATSSAMDRKAWIDYNMDGNFTNDELVMNELNAQNLSKIETLIISNTQRLGSTRMRVGVTYAGTQLNPIATYNGVFKDYRVAFPMDYVRPTIQLNGNTSVYTEIHKAFIDPGALANDNIEGNISARIETLGVVDTSKLGPNLLKYIVKDLYGNVSDTIHRMVFVILNNTGPSLVLNGSSNYYLEVNNKFVDPGYIAKDNQGNLLNNQVIISTNLDSSTLGLYSITYLVTDAFGMKSTVQRAVTVGDSTRPVIIPKGNPYVHQVGTALNLIDVVDVRDNYWGRDFIDLNIQGAIAIDVNKVGTYFVQFVARDNSGNVSNEFIASIEIRDTKVPIVKLKGESPMNWPIKNPFIDPWVMVSDNYWPEGSIVVNRKGTLNVNAFGNYPLWYIATDPSGNKDSVVRIVNIVDMAEPIIDLLNVFVVNIGLRELYKDAPIALIDNYDSDSSLRKNLVIKNSLPKDSLGRHYGGNEERLYTITYQVKDSWGNESEIERRLIYVTSKTTGQMENSFKDGVKVYPNPSEGKFTIQINSRQTEPVEVSVFDGLGKWVLTKQFDGNKQQENGLNLMNQPAGFYLIKIQLENQVITKKVLIK